MIMLLELFMNPSRKFKKVLLLGAAMFQVTYLAQLFGWLGCEFLLLVSRPGFQLRECSDNMFVCSFSSSGRPQAHHLFCVTGYSHKPGSQFGPQAI
jgi:hypothetical protein